MKTKNTLKDEVLTTMEVVRTQRHVNRVRKSPITPVGFIRMNLVRLSGHLVAGG